jgi:ABC-type nitrate/sulfonate/bicarbonate transport system substrate-binding protein
MKRIFIGLAICTLFFLSNSSFSKVKSKNLIGYVGNSPLNWHLYVMMEKDFLSELGPNTGIIQFRNPERALSALADGSIQVLGSINAEQVVDAQVRGAPIKIIGGVIHKIPYSLILSDRIRDIKDLNHCYIGVPSFNSGLTFLLREYLEEKGLFYKKNYQMVEISNVDSYQAIQKGVVSAALMNTPQAYNSELWRVVYDPWKYNKYLYSVITMNKYWGKDKEREVEEIMKALIKSINWLIKEEHRREAVNILRENIGIEKNLASVAYETLLLGDNRIFTENAEVYDEAIKNLINTMVKTGILGRNEFDFSSAVDDRFRENAILGLK